MSNKENQNLTSAEVLDAISYQLALAEAKHGTSTPDDERWSRELGEQLKTRLAEMRRNLLPSATVEKAKPIPPALICEKSRRHCAAGRASSSRRGAALLVLAETR